MREGTPEELEDKPLSVWQALKWFAWKASMYRLPRGPHITRYAMYQRLAQIGTQLPYKTGRTLAISHSRMLIAVVGLCPTEIVEANYPEQNILALDIPDESFDFVVSDQVLEHVEGNPQQAINECHRILKPGGIALHTTCFINPIHGAPSDFWRFTPYALTLLHKGWSRIFDSDGWGNFEAWSIVRCGLRFHGIPNATWHPLHKIATRNDPAWPIVTWIAAQR